MWKLVLLFVVLLSLVLTFFASDIGEQLKNRWAGIWCPGAKDEEYPDEFLVEYGENISTAPPRLRRGTREGCKSRVRTATGTASSVLVCLMVTYAIARIFGLTKTF